MDRPELSKSWGSTVLERHLDLYLQRSVSQDNDLESDIKKVCDKLCNSIIELDGFIKEISVVEDRVEAVETANFLRNRLYKDTHRMTALMISMREAELSRREKDAFANKLKGLLPL